MGTASDLRDSSDTTVSSLGLICVPWSSADWSRNWYWATKLFRPGKGDTTLVNYVRDYVLRLSLPFMIERRMDTVVNTGKDRVYTRPMSMKTCPPHSHLIGFDTLYKPVGSDGDKELIGFKSLLCRHGDSEFNVPLSPPSMPSHDSKFWDYDFAGGTFSLKQRIGKTTGLLSNYETKCPTNKVVSGIQISRDNPITDFHIHCKDGPF